MRTHSWPRHVLRCTAAGLLAAGLILPREAANAAGADDGTAALSLSRRMDGNGSPSALKTATFISLASINDFVFGYTFGGLLGGGAMIAANLTTGAGLYYVHEVIWDRASRVLGAADDTSQSRTTTFAIVNGARIYWLGHLLTGSPLLSTSFVITNTLTDAVAYYVTDRLWRPDEALEATSRKP